MFKNSVPTPQGTLRLTNRLMLFSETVAVYCENQTGHTSINTLCGHNVELLNIRGNGMSTYCHALKG
jgi:hypothetical protein